MPSNRRDEIMSLVIASHNHFKNILKSGQGLIDLEVTSSPFKDSARVFVGLIRPIQRANSVGVYLCSHFAPEGSFLDYGKASEWKFSGDIATHEDGLAYRLLVRK